MIIGYGKGGHSILLDMCINVPEYGLHVTTISLNKCSKKSVSLATEMNKGDNSEAANTGFPSL